jgi:hypothetical protein
VARALHPALYVCERGQSASASANKEAAAAYPRLPTYLLLPTDLLLPTYLLLPPC